MRRKEPFTLLGTSNWKSYAMFQAAVRLEELDESSSAETCIWMRCASIRGIAPRA
jgi:hypothetical protein